MLDPFRQQSNRNQMFLLRVNPENPNPHRIPTNHRDIDNPIARNLTSVGNHHDLIRFGRFQNCNYGSVSLIHFNSDNTLTAAITNRILSHRAPFTITVRSHCQHRRIFVGRKNLQADNPVISSQTATSNPLCHPAGRTNIRNLKMHRLPLTRTHKNRVRVPRYFCLNHLVTVTQRNTAKSIFADFLKG